MSIKVNWLNLFSMSTQLNRHMRLHESIGRVIHGCLPISSSAKSAQETTFSSASVAQIVSMGCKGKIAFGVRTFQQKRMTVTMSMLQDMVRRIAMKVTVLLRKIRFFHTSSIRQEIEFYTPLPAVHVTISLAASDCDISSTASSISSILKKSTRLSFQKLSRR